VNLSALSLRPKGLWGEASTKFRQSQELIGEVLIRVVLAGIVDLNLFPVHR
jgi:hypothetical protein